MYSTSTIYISKWE